MQDEVSAVDREKKLSDKMFLFYEWTFRLFQSTFGTVKEFF